MNLTTEPCYGGLDLSTTIDLSAFALYWPTLKACKLWCWCPADMLGKRKNYSQWVDSGHIVETGGEVIDYGFIRAKINELYDEYPIQDIGYDPYNATHIATLLHETDGIPMVKYPQGFGHISEPAKELERLIVAHELCHYSNPVLRWMISNAAIKTDASGNIKPVKPPAGSTKKIDGVVALTMAIGRSIVNSGDVARQTEILFL